MTQVRRADPAARRTLALVLVIGTGVGALLIAAFTRYRIPSSDWVLADRAQRIELVFVILTALGSLPLLGLAVYLWSLGERSSGPESSRRRAFGSFVIQLSSRVRGRSFEVVSSRCLRSSVAPHRSCWLVCCGASSSY
jgi:hypothetical protein